MWNKYLGCKKNQFIKFITFDTGYKSKSLLYKIKKHICLSFILTRNQNRGRFFSSYIGGGGRVPLAEWNFSNIF